MIYIHTHYSKGEKQKKSPSGDFLVTIKTLRCLYGIYAIVTEWIFEHI